MPTSLTRALQFEARHHLWVAGWSAAENQARFGSLTEPHAHDYHCSVTVTGPVDPALGMIMDLGRLDRILDEEVRQPLAGRHLNRDLAAFAGGPPPTCEALAEYLFGRIAPRLPAGVRLERVRIAEDATLSADCTGAS